MTVRVGINGFGRIGRNFLRAARAKGADLEIVAVNDITDAETNAVLLRHDSTHGHFPGDVRADEGHLLVDGRKITVLSERNPAELPWRELGATVVVESTGRFTDRAEAAAHLEGGAERVVVSAPSNGADLTIVMGVNDGIYDPASARRRLERILHDQLLRPDGEGPRGRLRHRRRPDDDRARDDQRPEPPGSGAQRT